MRKPPIACLIVLLSCCLLAACEKSNGWKEYKYRDDGFAISAPSKPLLRPQIPDEADSRTYGINYGNRTEILFGLGNVGAWENLPAKERLQRMEDLTLQGTSSKLISDKEISLDGNPGLEYEIEGASSHSRSRFYIVDGKLLAVQSYAPVDAPFAADTDRIFDSLHLLNSKR